MNISLIKNIDQSQEDYCKLLLQYKDTNFNPRNIAMLMDDIKCFWMERLSIIEYEIEALTENHLCFLLSGAIYLDVSAYEPFYFKSLGEYHFLFDPILKMEGFFRIAEKDISSQTIDFFRNVFDDTIEILTKYKGIFFILPIKEIAIEDNNKHQELLKKIFYNIISSMFSADFESEDDFCNTYSTYEQIEASLDANIKVQLIFNDRDESGFTLRNKIENYIKSQMNFSELIKSKTEPQIFLISMYSWLSQIIDILLICVIMRLNPYIRFSSFLKNSIIL